ncbi:MAG: hypothetical protein ACE5JP_10145 [Candidatus Bipolaricaulia bacterium]
MKLRIGRCRWLTLIFSLIVAWIALVSPVYGDAISVLVLDDSTTGFDAQFALQTEVGGIPTVLGYQVSESAVMTAAKLESLNFVFQGTPFQPYGSLDVGIRAGSLEATVGAYGRRSRPIGLAGLWSALGDVALSSDGTELRVLLFGRGEYTVGNFSFTGHLQIVNGELFAQPWLGKAPGSEIYPSGWRSLMADSYAQTGYLSFTNLLLNGIFRAAALPGTPTLGVGVVGFLSAWGPLLLVDFGVMRVRFSANFAAAFTDPVYRYLISIERVRGPRTVGLNLKAFDAENRISLLGRYKAGQGLVWVGAIRLVGSEIEAEIGVEQTL